jgi:hypothetical protein
MTGGEHAMIELTEEQRRALAEGPVRCLDPETGREFVLVPADSYPAGPVEEVAARSAADVDPLLMKAMQSFWKDLPILLDGWRTRGKWVAYHGERRVGIARRMNHLIEECKRLGLDPNEAYYAVIRPEHNPPWQPDEVEVMPLLDIDERPTS